ncbi:hypothetical protein KPL70_002400 [Citrus sinensis]|nr:hypothetical protein KPL70_002400 [Citrus sinensis]
MSQQPPLAVQSQPLMLNRGYGNTNKQQPWPLLQQNPSKIGNFGPSKPRNSSNNSNNNWKGKKITDKRNKQMGMGAGQGSAQGYNPPALHELQSQNRQKTRKFYPNKKKFNNNNNRFAPYAPRNTTSFIIRAKKSGGIASLVSPCPVTPAVLPTPIFSPSREVLGDMAKEEWGVDGCVGVEDANEGIVESGSENESENGSADVRENKEENNNEDVCMEDTLPNEAKKEEVIVRSELVNDDSLAKEDDRKKIEDMDNEMGLRDESRDGQRQTVKDFEEDGVNVAAEERVQGGMIKHGEEH